MLQSLRARLAVVIVLITLAASGVVGMSWSVAAGLMNRFDRAATEVVAETNFSLEQMSRLSALEADAEAYAQGDPTALSRIGERAEQVLAALEQGGADVEFEPGSEAELRSSILARMRELTALSRREPPWIDSADAEQLRRKLDVQARGAEFDLQALTRANTAEIAAQLDAATIKRDRLGIAISVGLTLLMALFLALAATVQRSVLRPLRHFRQRVEQLGRGEFESGTVLRGPTEITTLAQTFDAMAVDLQAAQTLLRSQALEDQLTGLANRHALVEELQRLQAAQRDATVLFIDLDDFKTINDSLGHSAGDALLAELAARVQAAIREQDVAVRLGGDEFAVLLVDTPTEQAQQLSQRLLDVIRAPMEVASAEISSTASIGIADSRTRGYAALLRNADIAMYAAKDSGKGQVATYHEGLQTNALTELNLAAELRHAFERSEFRLHYQPILRSSLAGGGVAHVEALLRWEHPERGLLAPGAFLSVAEKLPIMQAISHWVLRQALQDLAVFRELQPDLNVAVNVTANQLRSADFVGQVGSALQAVRLPATSLTLELTEREAMDDDVQARHLTVLRRQGVCLALDDFGTGYSSLAALRWLPVDILKIDRSFVGSIGNGPQDRTVVQATIAMAHALGLVTIAEGVETAEQDEHLDELGCDYVQGYWHARPMPFEQTRTYLAQQNAASASRAQLTTTTP